MSAVVKDISIYILVFALSRLRSAILFYFLYRVLYYRMRFQGFIHLLRTTKLSQALVLQCNFSTSVQPRVAIVGSGPAGIYFDELSRYK